ncbi:MAG: hypothetical protein IJC64_02350, partial [Clostridia bacterium]|nr:hypothetical protein [Clostridia bacterium]
GALCFFALCSLLQGGLNLLPIKSFDGGRMLYCAAAALGQRFADTVLAICSGACVLSLWTVALYLMIKIGAGLGIYVFCACLFASTLSDGELIKK